MNITKSDRRDLAAEHSCYLERITPIIRDRLARRGKDQEHIDAYLAALPTEHVVSILRKTTAARVRGC